VIPTQDRSQETAVRPEAGHLAVLLPYLLLADVALLAWYLSWLLSPHQMGTRWLYVVLVMVEIYNVAHALAFWWTVHPRLFGRRQIWWSTGRSGRVTPRWFGAPPDVAVLIPTFDEPISVVEPTIRAARRLQGATVTVYLLDDGDRQEMAALAQRYDISYIARTTTSGAKAGNLNHALTTVTAPFVAILDCDHIPEATFLTSTLGYFHEPELAYVQTPQTYRNRRVSPVCDAAASQQDLFYGPVAAGRNQAGRMYCCGTNVVFRRTAIEAVGGFPERSLTEDFAIAIRLHERGWQSEYVGLTLARGLGPTDLRSYVAQQARWAQGCIGQIPRILFGRLGPRRRLSYLVAASSWLAGFTTLVYLLLPLLRIFGGVQPLRHGVAWPFLDHFGPYFAASLATMAVASGGRFTYGAYAVRVTCFWVDIVAAGRSLIRRPGRWAVTPKAGQAPNQWPVLVVPATMLVALVAAVIYELTVQHGPAAMTTVAFALVWIVVLASGIGTGLTGYDPDAGGRRPSTLRPMALASRADGEEGQ
jgi:cellulose synthase (UDP-forming)